MNCNSGTLTSEWKPFKIRPFNKSIMKLFSGKTTIHTELPNSFLCLTIKYADTILNYQAFGECVQHERQI